MGAKNLSHRRRAESIQVLPPTAPRRPNRTTLHGDNLVDPYAWLRDADWAGVMREPETLSSEIKSHLDAENDYTEAVLADTGALRTALFDELRGRMKEDDASVPAPDGIFSYYHRYAEGGQHRIFCRRPTAGPATSEQVLLDGDQEARGVDYFDVGACEHSPDHRHLAYSVDLRGSEIYTVRLRDLATGTDLEDELPNAHGEFVWANDGASLLYVTLDDHHRPSRVYRHELGMPSEDDVLVYEETDPGFFVTVYRTESRRFIVIDAHDHTTSEVRLVDADDTTAAPRLVAVRERDVEYRVSHYGDRLLILTNARGAEDFMLAEAPLDDSSSASWRVVVPHRPGTLLVDFHVYAEHLVRLERCDALPRIVVTRIDGSQEHVIDVDEAAYSLGLMAGYEFDTSVLRYRISSPRSPESVYDYDMDERVRELRKVQEIPSGHDPRDYATRRLHATAPDGESVPVTVLHRVDTPLDGTAPLLLYGYGSYGHSIPASFSALRLSLVDRGFVYAIAHVRGGKERGYRWYREGKGPSKHNTFDDYIAVAEHLVHAGYTRTGQIAAQGASAGGMLIGAVVNARPALFKVAVAEVPFVDVLNTMCDDTLPLTPPEWPEWGNPRDDVDAYRTIRAYSPYDNVEAKAYPHILATAGLTDPRVGYWEPAKWVAKLRTVKTDDRLVCLKTYMGAGHAGAAGRFDYLKDVALVYAFILKAFDRLE